MSDVIVHRDFFISFNNADLAYAKAIDSTLRGAGFSTYFHPRDFGPGGNVPIWMEIALLNSAQTLALYSPDYTKDAAVYSKAERYATFWQDPTGDKRKLIPIVLRETDFTPLLAMISRIIVVGMTPEEAASHVLARLTSADEAAASDSLRSNQPLPAIFRAEYRPNPNFVGRLEIFGSLINSLRIGANPAIVAVVGMGGVGKTTLAAEYCHRFGSRYGGVWWVRSEQEPMMLADLQALSERLGIASTGNTEADARSTLDRLASLTRPWLLVYDNAPNPDAVRNWLPTGAVRCIVTSQFTEFEDIARVLRVDVWPNNLSAAYLLARTQRHDSEGAMRLAAHIGGLPLAAEQAAAYLSLRVGVSFDEYGRELVWLTKQPRPAGASGQYPATVYAVFVKSLKAAAETVAGTAALDFIRICAFLSPNGVDLALLSVVGAQPILPVSLATTLADKFAREDALAALASLSLLRRDDDAFGSILIFHRLLLEVARDWMGEDGRALWGCAAVRLVAGVFPEGNVHSDPSSWPRCALLMPHLSPLASYAPHLGESGAALAHVLGQASLYWCARGNFGGALLLAAHSVELLRGLGGDPLILAMGLNNLAMRHFDLQNLTEAEGFLRETLSIEEPRLPSDDPGLSITLSNFASICLEKREFEKAESLFERVAHIRKRAHGELSAEYAVSISNLGFLHGVWSRQPGQGAHLDRAQRYFTEALIITRAVRGERHPETATRHHNLATLKWERNDRLGAIEEIERSLAIRLSLDLWLHRDTHQVASELINYLNLSGGRERASRISNGDLSSLLPVIAKVEAEHLAWVKKVPGSRDFGPPSRFSAGFR